LILSDSGLAFARVERTLLSAAFDVDFDFARRPAATNATVEALDLDLVVDFASTLWSFSGEGMTGKGTTFSS